MDLAFLPSDPVHLRNLVAFCGKYNWLYETPVIRFLDLKLWNNVPKEWHEPLLSLDLLQTQNLANGIHQPSWPASLISFVEDCKILALKRSVEYPDSDLPLEDVFSNGMSSKKKHEVEQLSELVSSINKGNVDYMVDIGAGKGYISQVLAHKHGMTVINIEGQSHHSQAAKEREETVLSRIKKRQEKGYTELEIDSNHRCFHVTHYLEKNPGSFYFSDLLTSSDSDKFDDLLSSSAIRINELKKEREESKEATEAKENHKFGLMSLHGCADLSCSIIRLFSNSCTVKTLVCVGCCYMKIQQQTITRSKDQSFPMSSTLLKELEFAQIDPLSEELTVLGRLQGFLELATESCSQFRIMTLQELEHRQRQIYYRAILELGLQEAFNINKGQNNVFCIRKIASRSKFDSFKDYVEAAKDKIRILKDKKWLDPALVFGKEEYENVREEMFGKRLFVLYEENMVMFRGTMVFLSLQYALSELCESLVVLDRCYYLRERGFDASVVPIFDPVASPRNLAIVVKKSNSD